MGIVVLPCCDITFSDLGSKQGAVQSVKNFNGRDLFWKGNSITFEYYGNS